MSSTLNDKTAPEDAAELRAQQETAEKAWNAINDLPAGERQRAAEDWAAEYGHLFFWCCGSPVFGGPEAEEDYDAADRGNLHGSRVWWY